MYGKLNMSPIPQANGDSKLYEALASEQPAVCNAVRICSVPLRLTRALVGDLLKRFAPNVDAERFWQLSEGYGLLTQRDESEWRLDRKARQYFLDRLEQEDLPLAQRVHATVLDCLKPRAHPTLGTDQDRLQQAYHTTPSDQDAGAGLYWSIYCLVRASNRFAVLPVLAHLAESQIHWLRDYEQDIRLYCAASLYYEGSVDRKQRAAELLGAILEQSAPASIAIDARFLLGTLKERENRDEAIELYEQATKLRDSLDLTGEDPDVQRHLRLTLAKSFFNAASILQTRGDPQALDKAEDYYRYGIQFVSAIEPGYEATQRRHLIQVLQRRGEEEKAEDSSQRISQIEDPFRHVFLEDALSQTDDIGYVYYAISALNHGLGYDSQFVQIEVEQDGATRLEGTYNLRATSMLSRTDFYLETVPESTVGVHFESLESLTPKFTLDHGRLSVDNSGTERLEMIIDPPMEPGDQLAYRWTARSSPGTIATTPQQLEQVGLDYEYAFWDIIVPMKHLEIQVVIPWTQTRPLPPTWVELWRIGRWHAQTQTAYRAFLEGGPGRVHCQVAMRQPDKLQLGLKVNFPWLAMRYILAWRIKD